MDTIIVVEGHNLASLIDELTSRARGLKPYKLRVMVDGDRVKFKVNESTWSPPLGELDPMCSKAQRRSLPKGYAGKAIVQDDERAKGFDCPTCNSPAGKKCTEASEKGRKNVAYVHTKRIDLLRDWLESA